MQVVIDIPETYYEYCKKLEDAIEIQLAVKNGTPLPKGHGRLIDESQIPGDSAWDFSDRLMSTPTIVKADEEIK